MDTTERFEQWAIVEVMGHSRYAGLVTEQSLGGASFIRVDVPEIPGDMTSERRPGFTKLLGAGSIFAITPCTEASARQAAETFRSRQFEIFEMPNRQLTFRGDEIFDEEDL